MHSPKVMVVAGSSGEEFNSRTARKRTGAWHGPVPARPERLQVGPYVTF